MKANVENAFKLYSGDKPLGLFADKLEHNIKKMNEIYDDISFLFRSAEIENFEKLPDDRTERGRFAKLFKQFNLHLEAAKIQGFMWNKSSYVIEADGKKKTVKLRLDETTYLILALRYKELFASGGGGSNGDVPYEIDTYLTEINTGIIDADYMNSRFDKYLKALQSGTETQAILDELHKSFATLTQEEQKYANVFLYDVQNGDVTIEEGKNLRDYINDYIAHAKNDQIRRFSSVVGVDEESLRQFMQMKITEDNINEFGRFDRLKKTVNIEIAREYFSKTVGVPVKVFKVPMLVDQILRKFILGGECEF